LILLLKILLSVFLVARFYKTVFYKIKILFILFNKILKLPLTVSLKGELIGFVIFPALKNLLTDKNLLI